MVQSGYTSPFPKNRMPMQTAIDPPALTLGIAGAGAMGRGIAQIAAQAGVRVLLFDLAPGAAAVGDARRVEARAHEVAAQARRLAQDEVAVGREAFGHIGKVPDFGRL